MYRVFHYIIMTNTFINKFVWKLLDPLFEFYTLGCIYGGQNLGFEIYIRVTTPNWIVLAIAVSKAGEIKSDWLLVLHVRYIIILSGVAYDTAKLVISQTSHIVCKQTSFLINLKRCIRQLLLFQLLRKLL